MSAAPSPGPGGVTCSEFAAGLVTDYMEDALPAERRRAVHEHLSGCAACARLLAAMRRVAAAIRGTGPDPVDPEARANVLADCGPLLAELRARTERPEPAGDDSG